MCLSDISLPKSKQVKQMIKYFSDRSPLKALAGCPLAQACTWNEASDGKASPDLSANEVSTMDFKSRQNLPGLPRTRRDFPATAKSAARVAHPVMARPTLQVSPTMTPSLFRMQLMRWRVRSMPALLSSPKSPTCGMSCVNDANQILYKSF